MLACLCTPLPHGKQLDINQECPICVRKCVIVQYEVKGSLAIKVVRLGSKAVPVQGKQDIKGLGVATAASA